MNAEELREKLEKEYALPHNQAIYKKRQQKAELVYGHIKRNLGVSSFLLRGQEGVRAEMSLLSLCFDLRRMITLLGVQKLIGRLGKFFSGDTPLPPLWRASQCGIRYEVAGLMRSPLALAMLPAVVTQSDCYENRIFPLVLSSDERSPRTAFGISIFILRGANGNWHK